MQEARPISLERTLKTNQGLGVLDIVFDEVQEEDINVLFQVQTHCYKPYGNLMTHGLAVQLRYSAPTFLFFHHAPVVAPSVLCAFPLAT
eukprot:m.29724 g.29724  ORF g.29724 m.29724 type:complete len:89 (+) comp9200_c0_seq1:80-346(+)